MTGETNLAALLSRMEPVLNPGLYVFCHFPDGRYGDHAAFKPISSYQEQEGLTLVLPKEQADEFQLHYDMVLACITLSVHSSLAAVGLTAAVAAALTEAGISANVMAAYFHDHVFIAAEDSDRAMKALLELSR